MSNQSNPRTDICVGVAIDDVVTIDSTAEYVRVRAIDLYWARKSAAVARADHPDVDVLVDIEIVIASDPAVARALVGASRRKPRYDTMLYVGTPQGLATLIADMHALGIGDGVVLHPLMPSTTDVVYSRMLPLLRAKGIVRDPVRKAETA